MALSHALSGHAIDVSALGPRLATQRTSALFKSQDLEVMQLVLLAGKSLPPHGVPGEVTIQCIEGSLDVTMAQGATRLEAGQLLFLARGVVHGVSAATDASALVTIALKT